MQTNTFIFGCDQLQLIVWQLLFWNNIFYIFFFYTVAETSLLSGIFRALPKTFVTVKEPVVQAKY